jgi:hypothetical protein
MVRQLPASWQAEIAVLRSVINPVVPDDSFQTWRQGQDLAAKMANDYLEASRCLLNWW